jgi:hypothetical protein
MKKLFAVAALALLSVVGGASAANAAGPVSVCVNLNVNGQGTGGPVCPTDNIPALPAPALP